MGVSEELFMGKIFCIIGKSSSGKDTLYKQILKDGALGLLRIVPYTTRPIRFGETNGMEYFFTDEKGLLEFRRMGRVIEARSYQTVHGVWSYFTVNDGQIDLEKHNYLMITTLEAYVKIRDYFGFSAVWPVYIEVEDGVRLRRAIERESREEKPKYAELCRRFLADEKEFSEEKVRAAGIDRVFQNEDLLETQREITEYIRKLMQI